MKNGCTFPLGEVWTLFYILWSPQRKFEWSDEFIRRGNSNFCQPDGISETGNLLISVFELMQSSKAKSGVGIIKLWLRAIGEGAHVESPQIMMHTHGSALKGRYTTEVYLPGKASISPCVGIIQIRSRVGTAFCSLSAGCASSPFTRPILSNSQYPVKVSDQSGYCQSENVTVFSSDFHRTVTIQTQIRNVSMVTAPASHRGIPHKSATSEPRSSH